MLAPIQSRDEIIILLTLTTEECSKIVTDDHLDEFLTKPEVSNAIPRHGSSRRYLRYHLYKILVKAKKQIVSVCC